MSGTTAEEKRSRRPAWSPRHVLSAVHVPLSPPNPEGTRAPSLVRRGAEGNRGGRSCDTATAATAQLTLQTWAPPREPRPKARVGAGSDVDQEGVGGGNGSQSTAAWPGAGDQTPGVGQKSGETSQKEGAGSAAGAGREAESHVPGRGQGGVGVRGPVPQPWPCWAASPCAPPRCPPGSGSSDYLPGRPPQNPKGGPTPGRPGRAGRAPAGEGTHRAGSASVGSPERSGAVPLVWRDRSDDPTPILSARRAVVQARGHVPAWSRVGRRGRGAEAED